METVVEVRGARLAVDVAGDGPGAVVWSHGLLSDRATDDALGLLGWPELPPGRALVRYDARGHGRSSPARSAGEVTWEALGQDMLGVADAVGVGRFVAGGPSMGCATALHAAVAAPDRVEGLVLATPPVIWEGRPAQAKRYGAAVSLLRERPERAMALLAATLHASGPFGAVVAEGLPEATEVMARHLRGLDPAVVVEVLAGAARSDLPPSEVVAGLRQPALVLAWEGDPGHPLASAERLHDLLPGSELHVARSIDDVRTWPALLARFVAAIRPTG